MHNTITDWKVGPAFSFKMLLYCLWVPWNLSVGPLKKKKHRENGRSLWTYFSFFTEDKGSLYCFHLYEKRYRLEDIRHHYSSVFISSSYLSIWKKMKKSLWGTVHFKKCSIIRCIYKYSLRIPMIVDIVEMLSDSHWVVWGKNLDHHSWHSYRFPRLMFIWI